MVHRWGTKLTKLDFYAPNARYHLKGQKKEENLSHMLVLLKNGAQLRDKIEKTILLCTQPQYIP